MTTVIFNDEENQCPYCQSIFSSKPGLKKHVDTAKYCIRLRNIKLVCKGCSYTAQNEGDIDDHIKTCDQLKPSDDSHIDEKKVMDSKKSFHKPNSYSTEYINTHMAAYNNLSKEIENKIKSISLNEKDVNDENSLYILGTLLANLVMIGKDFLPEYNLQNKTNYITNIMAERKISSSLPNQKQIIDGIITESDNHSIGYILISYGFISDLSYIIPHLHPVLSTEIFPLDDLVERYTISYALSNIKRFIQDYFCNRVFFRVIYNESSNGSNFYYVHRRREDDLGNGYNIWKLDPYLIKLTQKLSASMLKTTVYLFRKIYYSVYHTNNYNPNWNSVENKKMYPILENAEKIYHNSQIASCNFILGEELRNGVMELGKHFPYDDELQGTITLTSMKQFNLMSSRVSVGIPPCLEYSIANFYLMFDNIDSSQIEIAGQEYMKLLSRYQSSQKLAHEYVSRMVEEKKDYHNLLLKQA